MAKGHGYSEDAKVRLSAHRGHEDYDEIALAQKPPSIT